MERREFLKTFGAVGTAASLGTAAGTAPAAHPRIDLHNHFYPPTYFDRIRELGSPEYTFDTDPAGTTIIEYRGARFFGIQPPMTDVSLRLDEMDRAGIDVQVLSVSVPNVFFGDEAKEPETARAANDAYAEVIAKHPRRFKGLASIPMDLPDAALSELARALDELRLNGVILLSHIRGKPLTDAAFRPFFEEANRRKLCVLIHPMLPEGMADQLKDYVLGPLVGFPFDSTLAVARMCYAGLLRDFPDIRFVIPHLGGAIPYLMARLDQGFHDFPACREKIDAPPSTYLKRLYFDTVSASAESVEMVRNLVGADHIALGTDYPHLPGSIRGSVETLEGLEISESERARIFGGTALEILNNA
jgi:aminocarboxymuconate-semialdehyde decarboxylase